nr:MBL fold metallo-hydrolase [Caulobacter sp. 17J65-9]
MGSGSSGGVPRADGDWGLCDPNDPRNRRSRCSLMLRRTPFNDPMQATTVVVDTSPDFRSQTAAAGAKRVDAALYTHDHADQVHGIDDLRCFAGKMRRRVPCFMDAATHASLITRFDYIFQDQAGYPAICDAWRIPPHGEAWAVDGPSGEIPVRTFDQEHGAIRSVGYRFGPLAYSPDVSALGPDALIALSGVEVWIVDALRWTPHPTHAHVDKALAWIAEVKPRRAILTNLHVDLDFEALAARLPAGVEPAYDGLRFTVELA